MIGYLIDELKAMMSTHQNDPITYRGLLNLLLLVEMRMERDEEEHEQYINYLDDEFEERS